MKTDLVLKLQALLSCITRWKCLSLHFYFCALLNDNKVSATDFNGFAVFNGNADVVPMCVWAFVFKADT